MFSKLLSLSRWQMVLELRNGCQVKVKFRALAGKHGLKMKPRVLLSVLGSTSEGWNVAAQRII